VNVAAQPVLIRSQETISKNDLEKLEAVAYKDNKGDEG
jgi:hypothetical protein